MGQIEAAQYLTKWATAIDTALTYLAYRDNFPGVFEYEVTEPFGKYLRSNLQKTGDYLVTVLVNEYIAEFFAQDEALTEAEVTNVTALIKANSGYRS